MPKVNRVVARKDYPDHKIIKGQLHYTWTLKTGPRSSKTYRQEKPPRPSQLTTSEYLGAIGDLQHDGFDSVETPEDLRDLAEQVREIGREQAEKFSNMPDGLQGGPTGELLQERESECEAWAEAIDATADELETAFDAIDADGDFGDDGSSQDDRRRAAIDNAVWCALEAAP